MALTSGIRHSVAHGHCMGKAETVVCPNYLLLCRSTGDLQARRGEKMRGLLPARLNHPLRRLVVAQAAGRTGGTR